MNVAAVMTQSVVTVDMDQALEHVATLLDIHGFHHLLVVNQRKVVGIISDRDVLRSLSPFIGKAAERSRDAEISPRRAEASRRAEPPR